MSILETKAYKIIDEEKVPVIKDWLGWERLQLIKTFTNEEKEIQSSERTLFNPS